MTLFATMAMDNFRVSRNRAVLGGSPSISIFPRVTRFGQPMDTFRRLGALIPISLNNGLSFNNNNDNNTVSQKPLSN